MKKKMLTTFPDMISHFCFEIMDDG